VLNPQPGNFVPSDRTHVGEGHQHAVLDPGLDDFARLCLGLMGGEPLDHFPGGALFRACRIGVSIFVRQTLLDLVQDFVEQS